VVPKLHNAGWSDDQIIEQKYARAPELNKAKVGYYTFFTEESREALKKHWEARRSKGEELKPESPLIKPIRARAITYESIRFSYARTLKRAGLSKKCQKFNVLHLHSLRKFFRTNLEAIMTRSMIERLMGHVSSEYLDGSYFRSPEKDMLEAYRKAIPNLMIMEDVVSEDFQKKQLLRQAALILGEDKLSMLKDILARTKNLDQAVSEFRKFKDEPNAETERKFQACSVNQRRQISAATSIIDTRTLRLIKIKRQVRALRPQ
jgi:hypothetical protein